MVSITGSVIGEKGVVDILNYWADIGVFSYILPFLLVFAVVYGILSRINLLGESGNNKGVNAVVSVAVGLLALQWDYVPEFFSVIFPYTGMGVSILLVAIILMGLFWDQKDSSKTAWVRTTFIIIGGVIAIIIILEALSDWSWSTGGWWDQYGPALITLAVLGTLVGMVIGGKKESNGGKTSKD